MLSNFSNSNLLFSYPPTHPFELGEAAKKAGGIFP